METDLRKPALPDREREALAEIAATRVRPAVARALLAAFLVPTACGILPEAWVRARAPDLLEQRARLWLPTVASLSRAWRTEGFAGVNQKLVAAIESIDHRVRLDSAFARLVRPPLQRLLVGAFGYGNGRVVTGREGWHFLGQAFEADTGPPFLDPATLRRRSLPEARRYPALDPDPVRGLRALGRQLRRRDVELVVLPIPEKDQIYPGRLHAGSWNGPPRNPSFAEFVARLERDGIPVYDPAPTLFAAARDSEPLYLPTDSHWSPAGMELVAEGLAEFLRDHAELPPAESISLSRHSRRFGFVGDLERLLGIAAVRALHPRVSIEIHSVRGPDGEPLRTDEGMAPIIVLGDSFSMVYSRWTGRSDSAGLGEQLAFHLGRPVRVLSEVQSSELPDRIRWLRREPELLRQARIVVYAFCARQLAVGNWTPLKLIPGGGRPRPRRPGAPAAHASTSVAPAAAAPTLATEERTR